MRHPALLALAVLLACPFSRAQDGAAAPRSPKEAWEDLQAELNDARARRDGVAFRAIRETRPKEFLAAWEKSGAGVAGEDRLYLGRFLSLAERHADAMEAFDAAAADEALGEDDRATARVSAASALEQAIRNGQIEEERVDALIAAKTKSLEALGGEERAPHRAGVHLALAGCHDARHAADAAIGHWLEAARAQPGQAARAASGIGGALVHQALDLERLDALKERAAKVADELAELFGREIERRRAAGAPPQQVEAMQRVTARIEALGAPLDLIGEPAPAWTLEHAFGETEQVGDLRGKVCMLDFWATWCPWCIRSFPALRDLLRDYGEDFAVVGVTASASAVFDQRYDLDDDLKAKAEGSGPPAPVARRPQGGDEQALADYRKAEIETIATFIGNHGMTWDVVMIDEQEPAAKYGLTGWPHALVLDRQGRVRYVKRGALLRDRPADVAAFREILDRLLAEEEPPAK